MSGSGFIAFVPALVKEVLYAPDVCPPPVALLFEVALTHHNTGNHEASINTYMKGLSEWESILKKQHYPELEAAENISFMQNVRRLEAQERAEAKLKARQEAQANGGAAEGGAGAPAGGGGGKDASGFDPLGDAGQDELEAERLKQEEEDEARRRKAVEAAHAAHDLVPVPGKIFLSLAVGSVYESAANDEAALAEYLVALRHLTGGGVPVYRTNLLAATVYSCLAGVYYHLGQYDFAGDYYFRALEVRENVLPENHVDTAAILNNLGCVLFLLSRTNDALVLMNRSKASLETQLPSSHPRRQLVEGNIRKVNQQFFKEPSSVPAAPFVPVTIPTIPGVDRAKKFYQPKPKKKKDDGKKKK